jgi:hypothetical protein
VRLLFLAGVNAMAGERILYVCFDPEFLVQRERALLSHGFNVYTVLGLDGVLSIGRVADFDFILIGDEGPLPDREDSIRHFKEDAVPVPVIALSRTREHLSGADYHVLACDPDTGFESLADRIRNCRNMA